MSLCLIIALGWAVVLVAWILLIVREMTRDSLPDPVRRNPLLSGLTLLVCLPFLAIVLPFVVPAALCRGRGLLAFWIVTVLYHIFLGLLAVLFLGVSVKEAAILLSVGCLVYGKRLDLGDRRIEGACGNLGACAEA